MAGSVFILLVCNRDFCIDFSLWCFLSHDWVVEMTGFFSEPSGVELSLLTDSLKKKMLSMCFKQTAVLF